MYKLLFTAIFVLNELTLIQGNYAEEVSGCPDVTFSFNQNSEICLFAFLLILTWALKKKKKQNNGTFVLGVEATAAH